MADYDIFREQLAIKYPSYGHALWEPSPRRPDRPVQVGDVGFIRRGKFHRLFNALLPADDPSHELGVPEYYEPLVPTILDHLDAGFLGRNHYCSAGVNVNPDPGYHSSPDDFPQVSFQYKRPRGAAVLSLPVAARREDTLAQGDFRRWMVKHIDSWFAFARNLGLGIEQMEDVILVTGCDRTRSWTNVAFLGSDGDAQASFGVKVEGAGTSINFQFSPERARGAVLRQGPEGTNLPENQCVFIRGLRVARSFWILPRRLMAAAGPSSDMGGYDYDPDTEVISIPAVTKYRDPLHLLQEYIAEEASDCDMVITHDDDLVTINGLGHDASLETLEPDVMMDLLRRSNIEIHKVLCDSSPTDGSPNTDTSVVKVATLSTTWQNRSTASPTQSSPISLQSFDFDHASESGVTSISSLPDSLPVPTTQGDISKRKTSLPADHGDSARLFPPISLLSPSSRNSLTAFRMHKDNPAQPLLFNQILIDEPFDSIEARVVHEKDLKTDDLLWLLVDGNSPRSVGISPAYSQSGGLQALACAFDTRVLIIRFHSTKAYRDGEATGSGTQPRNVERRMLLEEELLCRDLCTLYAFDLAPLALSLHLHFHICVTDAVDIQSALVIPNRSVMESVMKVVDDGSPIFSDNIIRAFENMLYQSSKHKDLNDLVQRAWLSYYIGQYDFEAIREMFYKAPKVDTAKFSLDELNILQKLAYDILRQDNMKPQSVTHEIKTRWDDKKQKMVAVSQRYANRVTPDARVLVNLAHGSDAEYRVSGVTGDAKSVRGKFAGPEVEHNLEGKNVTSITSIGKGVPTPAELECGEAILSMLQGTIPLLDDHWMKAIWLPFELVNWPKEFTPPPNSPTIEVITRSNAPLNPSQHSAITKMLSSSLDTNIMLIQGPPGTGKTTVIATYAISAIQAGKRGIWLMAQSNVAVKNIAEKLAKLDFFDFKLLVSPTFHFEWHEHLYRKISKNIIVPDNRFPNPSALQKTLQGSQVILCTLSMISNPMLRDVGLTQAVPIINVIIDEASQIKVGQYVPLFKTFGKTLRKICFVGDDKQLPPHGQDDLQNLQSIFEVGHLRESLSFLNTQYRMPPQIGDFISEQVYEGELLSHEGHVVPSSTIACRFVDVNGSEQLHQDGKSYLNRKEVEAITRLAHHLQEKDESYRIITPYDAQRSALEEALRDEDLKWEDKVFNVDSFQGNEDHIIIISVVRTKALGFLSSLRRTNVMLTRCQRAMYIVSSRAFLEGKGADSLVGKMAAELGKRPGAWLTHEDLESGRFE